MTKQQREDRQYERQLAAELSAEIAAIRKRGIKAKDLAGLNAPAETVKARVSRAAKLWKQPHPPTDPSQTPRPRFRESRK